MVLGEIFRFARHTITQNILALGMTDGDWSAWYRLFSRPRFDETQLNNHLLTETLAHAPESEPYGVAVDTTSLHRSSLKMPAPVGCGMRASRPFGPGFIGRNGLCMGPG